MFPILFSFVLRESFFQLVIALLVIMKQAA